MDIAKLRSPAWTESDGQSVILDPTIVPADMNEAADEIERLQKAKRAALNVADERSKENVALRAREDQLEGALHQIDSWSRAYPLKVFPEPDMAKAAELLKAGGMTLDAISASNMRHVVEEVGKIARGALGDLEQKASDAG